MIILVSMEEGMIPHTLNLFIALCSSANKSLHFYHIFIPLVEEESVSIMHDEKN